MAIRGDLTIRCCKELVKYVKCLHVVMQLPNSKWRPVLKIRYLCLEKQEKIWKSQGILSVKKSMNPE